MLHLLRITVVFLWVAAGMMSVLGEFDHHDDSAVSHAFTCDGHCGCICHGPVYTVMTADPLRLTALITLTPDTYLLTPPAADPFTVDHPPEQTS